MNTLCQLRLVGAGPMVVVDDDAIDIELASIAHASSNVMNEMLAFEDGRTFLDYLDNALVHGGLPSIVLLDINMPGMTGFEVMREMRANEAFNDLPIAMFLSNSDSPRDRRQVEEYGTHLQEKFTHPRDFTNFLNSLIP